MKGVFSSIGQERLFDAVVENLGQLGYTNELLQKQYSFVDYFEPTRPERIVPVAAFGQTPQSYDSACIAVLVPNGVSGVNLVHQCRALGAPIAFEVRDDAVVNWRVGRDLGRSKELLRIGPGQIDQVFENRRSDWSAQDVLRRKGIAFALGPRQLDFIDLGLIPAIEIQIKQKLDRLLREVVADALKLLGKKAHSPEELKGVYRLIFRFLASKILHDRGVNHFRRFSASTPRVQILDAVAKHYGEETTVPSHQGLQDLVASSIWTELDFRNLSVEVLAYVYEHTFVADEARKNLGTHGTPPSVARYIVHQLPFERFAEDRRKTVEPFCGHGVFLVAALQRLRELLPATVDAKERHKYFVRMLQGFEIDRFALEVARLCLMLADFPNSNGWKLREGDLLTSQKFADTLASTRIVISNPPFEDFTEAEKLTHPSLTSVHKPVELLNRLFEGLPADAVLGLVLPSRFLDGSGYSDARETMARRFQSIQIVSLPDGIFENSDMETVLLLGTEPRNDPARKLRIGFTHVAEKDRSAFLNEYGFTWRDEAQRTAADARVSLNVVALRELWERLGSSERLGNFVKIHKGVEWITSDTEDRVSDVPKKDFRLGVYSADGLLAFEQPKTRYSYFHRDRRRPRAPGGFDLPWDEPKVFVNVARISRGPWRIAAFADPSDLIANKRFFAVWPTRPWTLNAIAGFLNGAIANAYVAAHDLQRDVRIRTLKNIPLPAWTDADIKTLGRLVSEYGRVGGHDGKRAKEALLAIDAFILKGYDLPPRVERELLNLFSGIQRPVPFEFVEYFPEEFTSNIPLWMFLSADYKKCTAKNLLRQIPAITDPALIAAFDEVAQ